MYTEKVNVFQGCGEITPKPEGIAKKWFFLKAGSGNTNPAAVLPFGKISVCPYSGGYPSGYGNHCVNTFAHPKKFENGNMLMGFSHLQQSGTGAIGYYYNYLTVTPYCVEKKDYYPISDEKASPGYYSVKLDGKIGCELTVTEYTAKHRYSFSCDGGKISIDLIHHGLNYCKDCRNTVTEIKAEKISDNIITAEIKAEGITLYFAVRADFTLDITDNSYAVGTVNGKEANIDVSISAKNINKALSGLENDKLSFDDAKSLADEKWENELSKIKICADKDTEEIFYSNLYHSLIKPSDFSGESFIYDNPGPFMVDFATLWDMYKSAFPLIFMIDKDISEKVCETLLLTCEALGNIPNANGLTDRYLEHNSQARMLGCYVLIAAYRSGISIDAKRMIDAIERDLMADNKKDFTVEHKCGSCTWLLDMAEACGLTAQICEETGDSRKEMFAEFAKLWKTAFDENTGLLTDKSNYYEGTLYNYSFRPVVNMDERISLAGGKEKFVKLLDDFFGYGKDDVTLATDYNNGDYVADGYNLHRFDGYNNETDTEAPLSYIYAGRHDRCCEIVRAGMKYMFGKGRGGIPGNNDSGALSACYVFNALGIHPLTGFDAMMITSPLVDSAEIELSNGNKLSIRVNNNSNRNIYVKSVLFNGREIGDFMLTLREFFSGGTLEFNMTDRL